MRYCKLIIIHTIWNDFQCHQNKPKLTEADRAHTWTPSTGTCNKAAPHFEDQPKIEKNQGKVVTKKWRPGVHLHEKWREWFNKSGFKRGWSLKISSGWSFARGFTVTVLLMLVSTWVLVISHIYYKYYVSTGSTCFTVLLMNTLLW